MDYLLLTCFALSFLTAYILTPVWIKAAHKIELTGKDMHRYDKPEIAEMGGLVVNAGFLMGVLTYIGLSTFYFKHNTNLIYILAAISTCLIIMLVGIMDDLLGWKIGLRQWQKPLLTSVAALPMMVVNAGESGMILPMIGPVNFGILYPLLIVPVAITGAANGFNMLAGFAGLEAGMGIVILGTLGFVAWQTGSSWVAMLSLSMVFALLAFLKYNWHPAKIFPGDTFTYSVGALIATVAILGNMERIAIALFSLYFIEFLIKARTRFKGECYGIPDKVGKLSPPRNIESLTHVVMKLGKLKETQVVLSILALQVFLSFVVLLVML
jgi:UDP-N-acetylglucosamine--dolichyl-phosphate N-acetylglucosaminephosphotransferase